MDAEKDHMAVILSRDDLFRGAGEGKSRRQLVGLKTLDAVKDLSINLLFLLVFWYVKENRSCNDVLFIDTSGEGKFQKDKNQNTLRNSDIDRFVSTYEQRANVDKYAYVATRDEIKENDYNLSTPTMWTFLKQEEPVDID